MTDEGLLLFARGMAADTKAYVDAATARAFGVVVARCAELEKEVARLKSLEPAAVGPVGPAGPSGADGRSVDPVAVKAMVSESVREEVSRAVATLPPAPAGRDGKDADFLAVKTLAEALVASGLSGLPTLVQVEVEKSVSAIPIPKDGAAGRDGKDAEPIGPSIVDVMVAAQVELAVKRIALPAPKDGANGKDGASVTVADVEPVIAAAVTKAVAAIPKPMNGRDGVSVESSAVKAMVAEAVAAIQAPKDGKDGTSVDVGQIKAMVLDAVAALPLPKDGQNGKDGRDGASVDVGQIKAMVLDAVAAVPAPKDGRSITVDDVDPLITERVEKAVAAIPAPRDGVNGKDGQGVTVADIAPLVSEQVTKAVAAIPVPRDGVGVAGALIDKDGHLALTLSDGGVKMLGLVVGAAGTKGEQGPAGKDGSLEDAEIVQVSDRVFRMKRADGSFIKGEIRSELMLFRGPFEEGKSYQVGDVSVSRGSAYVALEPTSKRPSEKTGEKSAWAVIAHRGRDGAKGDQGPGGTEGRPGKDLTQLGSDGKKW